MSDRAVPDDIAQAGRECLSALLAAGIDIHPQDQPKALSVIVHALLTEREQLQIDVIAAVADQSEDCRRRVFTAIRRGLSQ
jgi:hypothetical protein